jgi:hypothetical protein
LCSDRDVAGTPGADNHEIGRSSLGEVEIGDAPPLVADDDNADGDSDGLDSIDVPATPRNRLASIPELQGAAGIAGSSSSEARRGSLPHLRRLTVLGELSMETFSAMTIKPSTLFAKAKALQPHKTRRDVGLHSGKPFPAASAQAVTDYKIQSKNPADKGKNAALGARDAVATLA